MVIESKTRAVLNATQKPKNERFKLWSEAAKSVTALDNLIPVTWKYEHAGFKIPKSVKYLRTANNRKDGKVDNRGITMVFMGYADEHAGNCYRMYNPVTSRVNVTQCIIWLRSMYFRTENVRKPRCYQSLQPRSQMI